jgi:hypothetical protein
MNIYYKYTSYTLYAPCKLYTHRVRFWKFVKLQYEKNKYLKVHVKNKYFEYLKKKFIFNYYYNYCFLPDNSLYYFIYLIAMEYFKH